jgi:MFS transporter, Spinster family, sphingosine-1-phosphate transporter
MDDNGYRRYLLLLLVVLYGFNTADRLTLGMVLQEIKVDLVLTDTQLGYPLPAGPIVATA